MMHAFDQRIYQYREFISSKDIMIKYSAKLRHKLIQLWVLTFSSMLIIGCTVGPDYKRPSIPAVQSYTRDDIDFTKSLATHSISSQQLIIGPDIERQWWTAFGSPELNHLVELAYKKILQLRVRKLRCVRLEKMQQPSLA